MPTSTKEVSFPLTNYADIAGSIIHRNVFEGKGNIIELAVVGIHTDNFNDSSFNGARFEKVTNADGSVVETTFLRTLALNSTDDAAIVYDKDVLSPRATKTWKRKHKFKVVASTTNMYPLFIYQHSSAPVCTDNITLAARQVAMIACNSTGGFTFVRWTSGGAQQHWNSTAWVAGDTYVIYAGAIGTIYHVELINDLTNLTYTIYAADGITVLATATSAWSAMRAESGAAYAVWGEPFTSHHYGEIISYQYYAEGLASWYPTNSPSPATTKTSLKVGDVIDMSTARVHRFKDGVVIDSLIDTDVTFKYAANGGAYGAAKTLSALRDETDVTITTATDSFGIYGLYASDGVYKSGSGDRIVFDVISQDGGGGGSNLDKLARYGYRRIGG